jgi:HlyD family secretion protein
MKWLSFGIIVLIALTLLGFGGTWFMRRGSESEVTYRTAQLKRGDVAAIITATGTVQAEDVIDVGAQVAGQIASLGTDAEGKPVDNNSPVKEGAILAQIDDALYRSDVQVADAQVIAAKAGVERAKADRDQAQAKLDQAERDWNRAQKLGPSEALAQVTYDNYRAVYETSRAALGVAKASIAQAEGQVSQAQAQLFRAQRNLGYTTIKSPVDGVVIDRRVNIGQTVVSSLNAPSLFLLAKDLSHMQVWVPVNEADIGNIRAGQPVTFSVDTYPDRKFYGSVRKVRLAAEMTQNVVTYLVEVATDNSDRRLRPYLSANVQFEVARRDNVLTVPNAALRWQPKTELIAPDARAAYEQQSARRARAEAAGGSGRMRGDRASSRPSSRPTSRRSHVRESEGTAIDAPETVDKPGTLWVRDGQYVRPINVHAGVTDNSVTEVWGEGLEEGKEIITGDVSPAATASAGGGGSGGGGTNPFAPPSFRGMRGSGGGRSGGGGR